jgi:hypothetical protein
MALAQSVSPLTLDQTAHLISHEFVWHQHDLPAEAKFKGGQ